MHSNSPTPHKKARIEIIPLIDIMFFLLASFMLVSLSLVKLQGAKVDLPPAGKPLSQDIQKPDFTTVSIDKAKKIFWTKNNSKEKEEIALETLGQRARQLYAQSKQENKDAKVYIAADQDVPYGEVLGIMDKLRKSGLTKVTFATKALTGAAAQTDAAAATAGTAPVAPAPAAAPPTSP